MSDSQNGNPRTTMKPCPFCGGLDVHICETEFEPHDRSAYAVSCRTRECHGVIFSLGFGLFRYEEDAIAAWNRRSG